MKKFKQIFVVFCASLAFGFFAIAFGIVLRKMAISINPDPSFIVAYDAGRMAVGSVIVFFCILLLVLHFIMSLMRRFLSKEHYQSDRQHDDDPDADTITEMKKKINEGIRHEMQRLIELMPEYEFDPFEKVLVRDFRNSEWRAAIFRNKDDREDHYPFRTTDNEGYSYCLPYNYITARLVNTTLSLEELLEQKEKEYEELNKDQAADGDSENKESED